MWDEVKVQCPYCWEPTLVDIDVSTGARRFVEDCHVCCQPILVTVRVDDDGNIAAVEAERENG